MTVKTMPESIKTITPIANVKKGPVLVIAGMHRSGTSFVSSILKEAGLHVGERLSPGEAGNTKGFFENTDFVHLHARILKQSGFNSWSLERITSISDDMRAELEETVRANAQDGPWGWKDPRTTLFLDLWMALLPDVKYLFVYRSPWEVIDSLYRRGDKTFQADPILALQVWEHYNQLSLEFYNRNRDRSLLVHVDAVSQNPGPLVEAIRDRLAIALAANVQSTFDESMFKKEKKGSNRPALVRTCFPEAYKLWQTLENTADIKSPAPLDEAPAENVSREFAQQVFTDWMELRKAQAAASKAEKALEGVKKSLDSSQEQIQWMERSPVWKIRGKLKNIRDLLSK